MHIVRGLRIMLVLLLASISAAAQTNPDSEAEVRNTITLFEAALQKHDIARIEALVSPRIVVFENGRRNDGWLDFRDHHLLPQFKRSSNQYRTDIVRLETTSSFAWAYGRTNRAHVASKPEMPDVWTIYILQKEGTVWKIAVLDWSVRRVE